MLNKLRGVNLGNWLVLEKWMNGDLFDGTNAEDETYFCLNLDDKEKRRRLTNHRDTFITESDFADIASKGFNAVRIPVPFFLFEDIGPYVACVQYLDKAFEWAERFGLKILVDLHTVPGSHNGTDNAGLCGLCLWTTNPDYIKYTLSVLEKIAQRYGHRQAMWGIEVLNEPMCSDTPTAPYLNIATLSQHYLPVDKEAAKNNQNYSFEFLKQFYRDAYILIRKHMPNDKFVVFHDAFSLQIWDDFISEELFHNIVLDTHLYLMSLDYTKIDVKSLDTYVKHLESFGDQLNQVSQKVPTIVGEWCIDNMAVKSMSTLERNIALKLIADSYLRVMDQCLGWFYWNYKLAISNNDIHLADIRECIQQGWMPDQY